MQYFSTHRPPLPLRIFGPGDTSFFVVWHAAHKPGPENTHYCTRLGDCALICASEVENAAMGQASGSMNIGDFVGVHRPRRHRFTGTFRYVGVLLLCSSVYKVSCLVTCAPASRSAQAAAQAVGRCAAPMSTLPHDVPLGNHGRLVFSIVQRVRQLACHLARTMWFSSTWSPAARLLLFPPIHPFFQDSKPTIFCQVIRCAALAWGASPLPYQRLQKQQIHQQHDLKTRRGTVMLLLVLAWRNSPGLLGVFMCLCLGCVSRVRADGFLHNPQLVWGLQGMSYFSCFKAVVKK